MHNRRNQVAVKPRLPRGKAAKAKPAPAFPDAILIPLHRSFSPVATAMPPALFAVPSAEKAATATPKRRKSAANRRKPPTPRAPAQVSTP